MTSRRIRLSRRAAFLLGLLVVLVVYPILVGALPWAVSTLTPRFGWTEGHPGACNLLGLIPVAVGIACLVWTFAVMLARIPELPEVVEFDEGERLLTATSRILITDGPFAFSRNPMYLSGVTVWIGWALFYGNVVVLIVAVVGWWLEDRFKVPQEERGLEVRFGEAYLAYKARVPRWLGPRRRRSTRGDGVAAAGTKGPIQ